MKNIFIKTIAKAKSKLLFLLVVTLSVCQFSSAQLAIYPLRTYTGQPPNGTVSFSAPGVNPGTVVTAANMELNNYNSAGLRMRTQVASATFPGLLLLLMDLDLTFLFHLLQEMIFILQV